MSARTCNASKGAMELTHLNPVTGQGLNELGFDSASGRLTSRSGDARRDIESVLNLNAAILVSNRKEARDTLRESLRIAQGRGEAQLRAELRRLHRRFTAPEDGVLPEYTFVALLYLGPRLRKNGIAAGPRS